ncbi:hypothetical protein FIBSPDRAFT_958051 [Athelia psychrophila]|uniref:Uncharacterized protein n=1 Tax=Athelia psychrophila TaxID=1759441 RepID=A0A166F0Y0_9AGAM|nr:hypothetical protein FIBSPDRAFT_958051 [Fibularhizoctonia sp. CBS 109695]
MEDRRESESESPHRSKRVKREDMGVKLEDMGLPDLEDFMQEAEKPAKTSAKAKAKSTRAAKSTSSSPRKPKAVKQTLETPHPAPPHWKETYDTIKEMRAQIVAPVDTMGCDRAQLKESEPKYRQRRTDKPIPLHPNTDFFLRRFGLSTQQ